MTLDPFPPQSRMRWRRLDVPGWEESLLVRAPDGWRLSGELEVTERSDLASLRYTIEVDESWCTRLATLDGDVAGHRLRVHLQADGAGQWTRNGRVLPVLNGALDIDLAFTPATNLLPIRRLQLAVGEARRVRSAWFRFPELRLEPLEQAYCREAPNVYRYVAEVDGEPFTARLDTDDEGRVLRYEGLWVADVAAPDKMQAREGGSG